MSEERDPVDGRAEGGADKTEGAREDGARTAGGWRSQAPGLKVLLFVSIAVVVFAVVRCSVELTPAPIRIASIGVLRPSVDVPEGILPAPADSIAILAARQLARVLAAASGVEAAVVESAGEGVDAVATFSLSSSRGNLGVVLEIMDARSRILASAETEGPPDHLYAIIGLAARRAAGEIWPASATTEGGRP